MISKDLDGFRREALHSKGLGSVGKQVVHPSQITVANEVYSPNEEEIATTKKLVSAYEIAAKNNVGDIKLNEKLVAAVHYRRAKSILEWQ